MTYSIIQKSQLEGAQRLDAEYYQPEYLEVAQILCKTGLKISDVSSSVQNFGAYSLCNYIQWQETGVPYLYVGDIKDGYIDFEDTKFISDTIYALLRKSQVKEGQVLLTMAGTIGNAAVAYKIPDKVNSNQAIAKITLKNNYSPLFLAAFLNSYYGRKQTEREIVSSVQPNIFLGQILNFFVPKVSRETSEEIEKIYIEFLSELEKSKNLYSQAEQLLVDELGLADFVPEDELTYVVNFSDVQQAERMDAEYFQPKFEKLLSSILNKQMRPLEKFVKSYSTGFLYKSNNYQESGIPLIRINNIRRGYIDLSDTAFLTNKDYQISSKDHAVPGDLVVSMSGTIGVCAVIPDDVPKSSINQRILKLTPQNIDKYYLSLVINSPVGQLQLSRMGTGGVQTNISYKDIKMILIPELPMSIQQRIADLVSQSHQARIQSRELLEQAKRKVEEIIEQGGDSHGA